MQAKEAETRAQYLKDTENDKNVRLCFPSMQGQINCMHSKLMLLSHPSRLRIVVPTANLVPYDWGEDGTMENCVFIIDLPRLNGTERPELTQFATELVRFLQAQTLDKTIIDSIQNFDFSATDAFAFLHTIGGAHTGDAAGRTGYPGLARAVRGLGLSRSELPEIDFVASSIGSLNMGFINNIARACQGADLIKDEDVKKASRKSPWTQAEPERNAAEKAVSERFRIYFPTHETVISSLAGGAGTICIQSKYFNSPVFPKDLLRDCVSTCSSVLMHNKIVYVRPAEADGTAAWAYIGSANCSESAWGNKIVKDREMKLPKLNCRNWECGVIVPCGGSAEHEMANGMDVFRGTVPVPMQWPGKRYGERKPWYFMEQG